MKTVRIRRAVTIICDETATIAVPDDWEFEPDFDDERVTWVDVKEGEKFSETVDADPWELLA